MCGKILEEVKKNRDAQNLKMAERKEKLDIENDPGNPEMAQIEELIKFTPGGDDFEEVTLFNAVTIRVLVSMDGETEKGMMRAVKMGRMAQSGLAYDHDALIDVMTNALAKMCMDSPYDLKSSWEDYHSAKGMINLITVLEAVMGPFEARIQKVQKFRKDAGGKTNRGPGGVLPNPATKTV